MEKATIAVLITSFNRKTVTLKCLQHLCWLSLPDRNDVKIFLVDDGSTDGTGKAVAKDFPKVNLIQGDSNLFWNGGMRLAWHEALEEGYDYYIWLNDDTILFPDALKKLVTTAQEFTDSIICGSTMDKETGQTTYGGRKFHGFWQRPAFTLIDPESKPIPCDTINGNCVLIPERIALKVGNLSSSFKHDLGDFDYGLRARKLGFSCWVAPGYIGTCSGHQLSGSHYDSSLPMHKRINKMKSPSGLPPIKDWLIFTKRHGGWSWPIFWARSLLRTIFPWLWLVIRKIPVK